MNEDLKNYIDGARAAGLDAPAIRKQLVESGWPATDVDAALNPGSVQAPAAIPAPVPMTVEKGPDIVSSKTRLARFLPIIAGPILLFLYFASYDRYEGPNWLIQYFLVLLVFFWIAASRYELGLIGNIGVALLTALAVFSAGLRILTVGLVLFLIGLRLGARWDIGGRKAVHIAIIGIITLWFLIGFASPGVREPWI